MLDYNVGKTEVPVPVCDPRDTQPIARQVEELTKMLFESNDTLENMICNIIGQPKPEEKAPDVNSLQDAMYRLMVLIERNRGMSIRLKELLF